MYLSAERLALANQTVQETFEQTSIAWQAIPHWDTGDPGQTRVRNDVVPERRRASSPLDTQADHADSVRQVTLAQASAPTPDALLADVMSATVKLARTVDDCRSSAISSPTGIAGPQVDFVTAVPSAS